MIASAEEFLRLRISVDPLEYGRAAHEQVSERVWFEIIATCPDMRRWVAHNKTVPLTVLARLAEDQDEKVRSAVARKRKLTAELFGVLSLDRAPSVRQCIAYNAKTPLAVLQRLAQDENALVANAAKVRLG